MPTRTSPRKAPRQERSRLTVEALLDAAAQVFERHGYAAGTTNRIAERAGVSIGSLYQYYPNKDAILVALVQRHLDEGVAAAGPVLTALVADPPPVDVGMRRLLEAMVALHRDRPKLHRVLFEEAPRPPALRRRLEALEEAVTDSVAAYLRARTAREALDRDGGATARAGVDGGRGAAARVAGGGDQGVAVARAAGGGDRGGALDRDPQLAARMVVRVVEAVTHELVLRPRGVAVEVYVDEAVVMLTRYLRN
jgi:AcrR family transcriptional regulator